MDHTRNLHVTQHRSSSALRSILVVLCLGAGVLCVGCQKAEPKPSPATSTQAVDGAAEEVHSDSTEEAGVINTEDFESGSLDSLDMQSGEGDLGDDEKETSTEPQDPSSPDH